jgi:hypothetical protein
VGRETLDPHFSPTLGTAIPRLAEPPMHEPQTTTTALLVTNWHMLVLPQPEPLDTPIPWTKARETLDLDE